jgi:hypothetical protein
MNRVKIVIECFLKAFFATGSVVSIIALLFSYLAFTNVDASSMLKLGDVFFAGCIMIYILFLLGVTIHHIAGKVDLAAILPKVGSAMEAGSGYADAVAKLVIPCNESIDVNSTVAIFDDNGGEELIGLGFIEKKRQDKKLEIVSYSTPDNVYYQYVAKMAA